MKYLIILISLFSINANALTCYLLDRNGRQQVDCVSGFVPQNILSISPIDPDTNKQAMLPEFIKLDNGKYVFDRAGKDAWLAQKAIDEAARAQEKVDKAAQKADLITACNGQGNGTIKKLCDYILNN